MKSSVIKSELQIYDLMNFFEKKKVRSFDLKFKASQNGFKIQKYDELKCG